jgi:cytoskeletal protein CcmA (bactofilin family)
MWNKRNDSPEPPAPPPQRPPATPIHRQEPVAPPPQPRSDKAVIGASMKIKGDIAAREELIIDGEVEGNITLQDRLTVGPNGKVRATIKAREVVVFGSVQGNVNAADKLAIRDKGSLVGDIQTAGIIIDDGAYFKGSIDIVKGEAVRQKAANE